jgi:hypothetical protein
MKFFLRLCENGGKNMLTFIVGIAVGSCSMLFIMSLMAAAKNADQQMEIIYQKN